GREAVRRPGDGIRLARARAVLHEVAVSGAVRPRRRLEPAHDVELVKAREDERRRLAGLLVLLEVEEAREQIEEAVAREHLAPQVTGLVPARRRRIPGAAVVAAVEGQKARALASELRGHRDRIGVDSEVDERPTVEAKQRHLRVARPHELLDGVAGAL